MKAFVNLSSLILDPFCKSKRVYLSNRTWIKCLPNLCQISHHSGCSESYLSSTLSPVLSSAVSTLIGFRNALFETASRSTPSYAWTGETNQTSIVWYWSYHQSISNWSSQHSPSSLVVVNRLTHICLVHERYKILRVLFLELMMLLIVLRAILMTHVLDLNVHLFVHLIRLVCAFIQIFSYAVELKLYEFGLAVSFVVVVVVQLLPLHLDVLKLNSRFVHPLVYQEGLSHWVHWFTKI